MRTSLFPLALLVGLCVTNTGHAQNGSTPLPRRSAEEIQAAGLDASRHFDLSALEKRLSPLVLGAYPDAKIRLAGTELNISYHSDGYGTHLTDPDGQLSKESPTKFSSDFSEFSLRVGVDLDSDHSNSFNQTHSDTKPFGTTFFGSYKLKEVELDPFSVVPLGHWTYSAYYKMASRGFFPEPRNQRNWQMTRYEFAVAIIRLLDSPKGQDADKEKFTAEALAVLKREFAPELFELSPRVDNTPQGNARGRLWGSSYERLHLDFSYGRGVSPTLVEQIKHIVADYATETLEANTSPRNAFVHED